VPRSRSAGIELRGAKRSLVAKGITFTFLLGLMYASVVIDKRSKKSFQDDVMSKDSSSNGEEYAATAHQKEPTTYKIFNPYDFLREQERKNGVQKEKQFDPQIHKVKVALLMSFPNSGTSYTLKNTRHVSNVTTASNYCGHDDNNYTPIWKDDPFSPQPHIIPEGVPHELPKHYVLTKTHCNHCDHCPPQEYLVSPSKFRNDCLTECVVASKSSPNQDAIKPHEAYPVSEVGKVVHLIRNPLDNIISRFHCFMKSVTRKRKRKSKYVLYQNITVKTVSGFKEYCDIQDGNFLEDEKAIFGSELMDLALRVPCHADFLRYVVWHNHAFELTQKWQRRQHIETHILHYDDYLSSYNNTVSRLLDFMEMSWAADPVEFHWSNYSAHYTPEQITAIHELVNYTASESTMAQLKRYGFEG
jgi:hypothetical protein